MPIHRMLLCFPNPFLNPDFLTTRCDAMMAILVKATGVSIVSIQEDAIRLAIKAQDKSTGQLPA